MAYPDDRGAILVSLQDRTLYDHAAFGHLALGVLIGPDRAVFDLPTELVIRDEAQLEVVIAPTAPGDADVIEHIRPLQVQIRSLTPTPTARTALVPLAQDSRYGAALPRVSQDELARALDRTGEIWSALIELQVVTTVLRDINPMAALTRIADIEALQRPRVVTQLLGRSTTDIINCPFSNDTECGHGGFLVPRP